MAFSSLAAYFRQAGCCIYGCSTDGIASHHAWARSELGRGPNIPLLSDVCGRLASRFGLFDPEESMTLPGVALLNARGEEQGVISSSLDFDQLALLTLGFVKEVGKDMKSQAIKTAMSHEPCKVEGGRRKETGVEKAKPKVEEPKFKLPPGASAINTFWTKVTKRDAGEDEEDKALSSVPRRLKFPQSTIDPVQAPERSRPKSWCSAATPKCPVCGKSVYPLDQVFAADRKPFHKSCIGCQTRGCPNQLTARGMHRLAGLVVCSSCESKANPPVYATAPYKETAEDIAMKAVIQKKKEEAPQKIMAEMKHMMDIIHNREGADEKEVRPSVVVHKLEGLEEFCQKAQGSIFCEKAQGL
jgi:hypothetical protein